MEDKLQILSTAVGVLTFLLIFVQSKWAATRREVELITEHNAARQRLIELQAYAEGQLRTIERIVSMQEDMLEMRRNFNNYLLDLMFLTLEGEELKPHLDLVKDAVESEDED